MVIRIVFAALILFFGSAWQALALLGPEVSIGVRIGASVFQEDEVFDTDTEINTAPVLGLVAGIRQGQLGGELSLDRMKTDIETDIKEGELTIVPVLLTAQFHFLEEAKSFDPYIGLGVGYYLNSFSTSSEAKASATAAGLDNYDVEVENAVGFHINLGANMKVSNALAFTIDARYAIAETDIEQKGTITGIPLTISDDLSLDAFVITGGVKYIFPK